MQKQVILVVDYGTSNVRVNAVDTEDGAILFSSSKKYLIRSKESGYAEIAADELWTFSEDCMADVMDQIRQYRKETSEEIVLRAIAFSFFGDNLIPVDKDGNALNDCILCTDSRGEEEVTEIYRGIPEDEQIEIIGDSYNLYKFGTKVLWVKKHMPEIAEKTTYYDSQQQYIFRKLGIPAVNDYTMAARKQMCELSPQKWSKRFLDVFGLTEESLGAEIIGTGEIAGHINSYGKVAFETQLPVIAGGHDCAVAMIGLGIINEKKNVVGDVTGTFDHVGFLAADIVNLRKKHPEFPMCSYNGPLKNTSICLGAFPTAGATLEWFMRNIHGGTSKEDYNTYWDNISFDGKEGVMVIPTLNNARGVIERIDVNTKKADIFKAVIEALTFENRRLINNCRAVKSSGIDRVRIGGGAANSDEWMQLRADIAGVKIERMKNIQISSVGCAVLAAVATGIYPDLESAVDKMVQVQDVFVPNPEVQQKYEIKYQKYLKKQTVFLGKES